MSRVTGLHHVQLAAPGGSEDVLRAFYDDLLGIPEGAKPPVLAARGGVWLRSVGVEIHGGRASRSGTSGSGGARRDPPGPARARTAERSRRRGRPAEHRLRLQAGQPVPGEVDQVRGHVGLLGLAGVEPPLAGERDHADQHLGVHRGVLRRRSRACLNWLTRMYSTWVATSLISEANEPVDWATGESRTRIRKPSVDCSM